MFYRTLTHILNHFSSLYPLSVLRGSGKTTLAKTVFAEKPYISFENFDIRTKALADPRAFLDIYKNSGAIFDEIQKAPILMSYLQEIADTPKERENIS